MFTLFHWAAALVRRLTSGPPLCGVRLVVPLSAPGAIVEVGFQRGRLAVRLVRSSLQPATTWAEPAWTDPSWSDPDADLGRHDIWARY